MGTEDVTPDMIHQAAANLRKAGQRPQPGGLRGFLIRLLEGKDVRQPFVRHRAAGMVVSSMLERTTANTVYVSASSWTKAVAQYTQYLTASDEEALAMMTSGLVGAEADKLIGPDPVWMVTVSAHEVRSGL